MTVLPSIRIYINKIENRITFKIKTWHYLERLTPETMKLLWISKNKMTKNENGDNVPNLQITRVALIRYNIVSNIYQWNSRVLYTFVANKSFGELLDIPPKTLIFLKTFHSEFLYIKVWFTDDNFDLKWNQHII